MTDGHSFFRTFRRVGDSGRGAGSNGDDTGLCCPSCEKSNLLIRFSCLQTRFVCEGCRKSFSLDQLIPHLDEDQFEEIEKRVGGRLSDRL